MYSGQEGRSIMVQRMTMAWVKWLGCAGLLLLLSGPVMAAEGVLEILAAGDVLLGGRMLEAPQAGELFGPLTRRRLEQADIFLWNCEIAGLSSVSKQNTFVFHADGLLFPQMAFANGAACTANNHVFDGLEEGAANLMAVLEGARIRHNGLHDRGTFAPLSLLPQREPPVYLLTGSPMSQIGSGPRIVTLSYPQLLEAVRTSCIPMTGTKVFPRLRIASGSGRTGLPPQGRTSSFSPTAIATAGSRPSRPRRARPSWPGDWGIFCSAATEAGGAGAMCACCPSVSIWPPAANPPAGCTGRPKTGSFPCTAWTKACCGRCRIWGPGLPPSSASLRWKGTNRKRPMKDSGWAHCSCSGKIFRLCRACGRPGRTAARMRRWGRQEAWSTISWSAGFKKRYMQGHDACPGSRTGIGQNRRGGRYSCRLFV